MKIWRKFRRTIGLSCLVIILLLAKSARMLGNGEFQLEKQGDAIVVKGEEDVQPFLDYINSVTLEIRRSDGTVIYVPGIFTDPKARDRFVKDLRNEGFNVTLANLFNEDPTNDLIEAFGDRLAPLPEVTGNYEKGIGYSGGCQKLINSVASGSLKVRELHLIAPQYLVADLEYIARTTATKIYLYPTYGNIIDDAGNFLQFSLSRWDSNIIIPEANLNLGPFNLRFGPWFDIEDTSGKPGGFLKITYTGQGDQWVKVINVYASEHSGAVGEQIIRTIFGLQPRGGVGGDGAGGVGSGGGGGIESRPLWLGQPGVFRYSTGFKKGSNHILQDSPGLLAQFIPLQGPQGELGHSVIPKDVIGNSNAINAVGMDYVDGTTGQVVASIFGAETLNSVYEHDYAVCSRVQNYELQAILPFRYNLHWWWMIRAVKSTAGYDELVVPLTIKLNGSQAVVDSRYLVDYYPSPISGTVLNYQIRAVDLPDAIFFLDSVLAALAQRYTVSFENLSEPPLPTVFARTATYRNPNIQLLLENQGLECSVHFFGPIWTEPNAQGEKFVEFNINVSSGVSEVNLPVGPISDAVIYIKAGDFFDKVYVANGYWFAWDDRASGGTSQVSLKTSELQHPAIPGTDISFVSPPLAEMTGSVTEALSWSHVGIGYVFQQGKEPIDLSDCNAVLFYTHGDGKQYRVKLESASVKDNDYHGALFLAESEWTLINVPFSELKQEVWGQPVTWTGNDIQTISFVTVGRPHESVHLVVDRISFMKKDYPRCLPSVAKPTGDLTNDCVVDYADIDLMADQWLKTSPPDLIADLNNDGKVDLKDFAKVAQGWLEEMLWP